MTRPYRPPTKRRMIAVQRRTGRTPEQQADWVVGVRDAARLFGRDRTNIHNWINQGRRRRTEMSFHKLRACDYGIGDESRFWMRMQDVLAFAVDWNLKIHVWSADDELWLQRGRVAYMLTCGHDPLALIQVIQHRQESESIQ